MLGAFIRLAIVDTFSISLKGLNDQSPKARSIGDLSANFCAFNFYIINFKKPIPTVIFQSQITYLIASFTLFNLG